jgi:hemoglobin
MARNNEITLYEHMGGADTVRSLVEAFYTRVQLDPLLAPLFPEDITLVLEKQYLFLIQFFGGPPLYTEQYGHPMMRARHMPVSITNTHAAAWLNCMQHAMKEIKLPDPLVEALMDRLKGPAYHFVNTPEHSN